MAWASDCPTETRFAIALTFSDSYHITFVIPVTVNLWLKARGVELGASLFTAGVLIGGCRMLVCR